MICINFLPAIVAEFSGFHGALTYLMAIFGIKAFVA
jgi:hypothetical protein